MAKMAIMDPIPNERSLECKTIGKMMPMSRMIVAIRVRQWKEFPLWMIGLTVAGAPNASRKSTSTELGYT